MKLFAISDLHLAKSISKPMDVFGGDWKNYMDRTEKNWMANIGDDDCVIVPGDISWATYLEQVYEDFNFIDSLPGRKILSKGNHDYWWNSMKKLKKYVVANEFKSMEFLHNNSYDLGSVAVCGTRGWKLPGDESFEESDRKIYERELQRLELSLKSLGDKCGRKLVAALHFPPLGTGGSGSGFVEIMVEYGVDLCVYGHLHGNPEKIFEGNYSGIDFKFVSAEYLSFTPLLLYGNL